VHPARSSNRASAGSHRLDQPLRALWETIGAAGHPPRDQSRQFAIIAVVLLVLAWVVVPVAITFAIGAG